MKTHLVYFLYSWNRWERDKNAKFPKTFNSPYFTVSSTLYLGYSQDYGTGNGVPVISLFTFHRASSTCLVSERSNDDVNQAWTTSGGLDLTLFLAKINPFSPLRRGREENVKHTVFPNSSKFWASVQTMCHGRHSSQHEDHTMAYRPPQIIANHCCRY